jgi:hypothetical protein
MPKRPLLERPGWPAQTAALASLAVMLLLVVLGGLATPGYQHASQFISELGARGAPTEWAVRWLGFAPAGLLLLAFCGWAWAAAPRSASASWGFAGLAVFAAGYLVAAVFPCDPGCRPQQPSVSQAVHNLGGLLGYLLAPLALFLLARAAGRWPPAGRLAAAGHVAAGLALLGVLTLSPDSPLVGLSQRLLELSVLGWASACGVYLARSERSGVGRP